MSDCFHCSGTTPNFKDKLMTFNIMELDLSEMCLIITYPMPEEPGAEFVFTSSSVCCHSSNVISSIKLAIHSVNLPFGLYILLQKAFCSINLVLRFRKIPAKVSFAWFLIVLGSS